jgi:chromosome segregation ATPase
MYDFENNNLLELDTKIQEQKEKLLELEKEVRAKCDTSYNNNDEEEIQYQNKLAEEYGNSINALRNENAFLKQSLDEKNKIIESFQKVYIEAQEKMNSLFNENKKLNDEINVIKNKLAKFKNDKKEDEKKKQIEMEDEIAYLKNEIKNLNNYFNCQLNEKEALINGLQENCKNLQNQINSSKKKSCLENNCGNPLNKCEEKFSFYKNYNSTNYTTRNPCGNC